MLFPLGLLVASATLFRARAYPNGAPNARLPTLGWSSWIALGPAGSAPVFDYCDEATVKASADAFVALGLYDAGYRHFHLRVGAAALRAVRARGTQCGRAARSASARGAAGRSLRARSAHRILSCGFARARQRALLRPFIAVTTAGPRPSATRETTRTPSSTTSRACQR